jgi:hypothetical protein
VTSPGTTPERALKPLPEYECGACARKFGTNFAIDEIECAECEARRCPFCRQWFGGDMSTFGPDADFPATWHGGHALIIEFGDEELFARCQCGADLGGGTPGKSLDDFSLPWERHVMAPAAAGGRDAADGGE